MMAGVLKESAAYDVLDALERIWSVKMLPFDVRRYMCGSVYQAAVRQGDEAIPRELWARAFVDGDMLPNEQIDMFEDIHVFLFVDKKLRPSYAQIVLHMTLKYLEKNFKQILPDVQLPPSAQAPELN